MTTDCTDNTDGNSGQLNKNFLIRVIRAIRGSASSPRSDPLALGMAGREGGRGGGAGTGRGGESDLGRGDPGGRSGGEGTARGAVAGGEEGGWGGARRARTPEAPRRPPGGWGGATWPATWGGRPGRGPSNGTPPTAGTGGDGGEGSLGRGVIIPVWVRVGGDLRRSGKVWGGLCLGWVARRTHWNPLLGRPAARSPWELGRWREGHWITRRPGPFPKPPGRSRGVGGGMWSRVGRNDRMAARWMRGGGMGARPDAIDQSGGGVGWRGEGWVRVIRRFLMGLSHGEMA